MLVLDFALLSLGIAGVVSASVLARRRFPNEHIGWADQGGPKVSLLLSVSIFVAVLGGAPAERRLGWWVYTMAIGLMILAGPVPRLLHNRDVRLRATRAAHSS